jgi:hypothetical protein
MSAPTPAADELQLTPIELKSGLWLKLVEHYTAELKTLRKKNDGNLQPDDTARLRGRIAEIKKLLALDPSRTDE